MHLCYIDESGTSDLPGNSSHFVLAGLSIPIWHWKTFDSQIARIKSKFRLPNTEIHVAWIKRNYLEQSKIPNFGSLSDSQRRSSISRYRRQELLRLQRTNNKQYKQTKKNYKKTEPYIHLTRSERDDLIQELANCVSNWGSARLFAECVDKIFFDPTRTTSSIDEQAFEQIVSRFEQYLNITGSNATPSNYGLLIHDHNETIARKHTQMMREYLQRGTLWTSLNNIIETPLFVDSQLTSMVQIADLCSYALRRYLENGEEDLFNQIFERADRKGGVVVGVRHFTDPSCQCKICESRKSPL